MADDIAAHGLLQNLVAYEDEGLIYAFAGGRRYRGLKELAKRTGHIPSPRTRGSSDVASEGLDLRDMRRRANAPLDEGRLP